jgi:hypothetical protein
MGLVLKWECPVLMDTLQCKLITDILLLQDSSMAEHLLLEEEQCTNTPCMKSHLYTLCTT